MVLVTPSTADKVGLSRSGFYRAASAGDFTRVVRGVYLPADAPAVDWNVLEAAARSSQATICLTSALAYHELVDVIPAALDVAIPRGGRCPVSEQAIAWHQFDAATFEVGREELPVEGSGLSIGLYSPERAIVDAFRLRGQVGYEVGRDALKEWLRRGGKPSAVVQVAVQLPRAKTPILQALEVLV